MQQKLRIIPDNGRVSHGFHGWRRDYDAVWERAGRRAESSVHLRVFICFTYCYEISLAGSRCILSEWKRPSDTLMLRAAPDCPHGRFPHGKLTGIPMQTCPYCAHSVARLRCADENKNNTLHHTATTPSPNPPRSPLARARRGIVRIDPRRRRIRAGGNDGSLSRHSQRCREG